MGCVVNGPGESRHADIGISLPGTFEEPKAPVYMGGELYKTLRGDGLVEEFLEILNEYVDRRYSQGGAGAPAWLLPSQARPQLAETTLRPDPIVSVPGTASAPSFLHPL